MRALTVQPGVPNSIQLDEVSEPLPAEGSVLARALALGICGTDREILSGAYGSAPPGQQRLILGHESLGTVEDAPAGSGLAPGDLIVGIVRRPDPVPCAACGCGEWDMCRNGRYTERGIKERQGYGSERFRVEPGFAIKIDPALGSLGVLLEPASIVAKAWDHVEAIGHRTHSWKPQRVLIAGAGPIGLLAALMAVQRGLDLHVLDHNRGGPKEALVRDLGGQFHTGELAALAPLQPDIVMECTGTGSLIRDCLRFPLIDGIVCLVGVGVPGEKFELDIGQMNRRMVLTNEVIFGAVNANRRHYEMAASVLKRADKTWLARMITRRVPLARFSDAFERRPGDVKVVIDFTG